MGSGCLDSCNKQLEIIDFIHNMIYGSVAVSAVSISIVTGDASPGDHNIRDSAEIVPGGTVCVTGDRG